MDENKLKILTESAKYDVSCSSSGSNRRNTAEGIGNAASGGICHSFTEDGRCISLLKILLSNDCIFSCRYCVNRADNDVERATATAEEICSLVMAFYKRNYIEGLFLSSAVHVSPDYTMAELVKVVKMLRVDYRFNGYIHLKGIPRADPALMYEGAKYADRMSYNLELPSEQSLKLLAPQKSKESLLTPMRSLTLRKTELIENKVKGRFLPAGQSTQLIVGATPDADGRILRLTQALYDKIHLKRVYYSAYLPTVYDKLLPQKPAGLLREHRLYQADWLLRFYGFTVDELVTEDENLPLDMDPKCAWAMKHLQLFPVEVNTCPLEMLLRVPGIGAKSAQKIVLARRHTALRYEDLAKMRVVLKRAKHFITCNGKFFGTERESVLRHNLTMTDESNFQQLSLFSTNETALSCLSGEI
jgi:putative DNA modification/repair radical SAM protein